MKKFFLYFISILFLVGLVHAYAVAQECKSPAVIHNEITAFYSERNRETKQIHSFDGERAQEYLVFYNALPPVTTLEADEVVLYMTMPSPLVTEVFFLDGCFVSGSSIPFSLYRTIWSEFYEEKDA